MIKNINLQVLPLQKVLKAKHIAIPAEHGAWVFLFSPLLIGLAIGGLSRGSLPLVSALLAVFLIRQPLTILVKVLSGRRHKKDLYPAVIWLIIYSVILIVSLVVLILLKYQFILYLAVPAIPVFIWHLWLVSKRAERRQRLIEIVAGGVLALAAPAAFWVGLERYAPLGWLLWGLVWLQVAGTIQTAYLRLHQRQLRELPPRSELLLLLLRMSAPALLFNTILFIAVVILAIIGWVPSFIPLAFVIQPLEVIWGTFHPAISMSPVKIGIRQLVISSLFTVVFIITWLVG
jgi:hypothetical protein